MADVENVADQLYALLPGEFVAARDEAVRAARSEGDRDTATQVAALRKPTTTAWLVNLLVRDDPALADSLRELGQGLRAAEASLAGAELTALDRQRRQLVAGLVRTARTLARDAGQRVTQAGADEVGQTLLAALADAEAADEVLSGRLTRGREHVGFGAGRRSPQLGLVPPSKERDAGRQAEVRRRESERRESERRESAGAALRSAEEQHAVAVRDEREAATVLSRARALHGERQQVVERLTDELARLTERLEQATAAADEAAAQVQAVMGPHDAATKALRWAERDLDQARAGVERTT